MAACPRSHLTAKQALWVPGPQVDTLPRAHWQLEGSRALEPSRSAPALVRSTGGFSLSLGMQAKAAPPNSITPPGAM